MEKFITVATFNYVHEIAILRHRLEQEGIEHYFANETTATVAPMYSFAFGGIRLRIRPNDLDTVKAILQEFENNTDLKIV